MNFSESSKSEGAGRNAAEKNSQLIRAAEDGDASKVLALISGGADVRAKDNNGWTPLHMAGWNGHAAAVGALLAKGADVRAKTNAGWTPLHMAAGNGHAAVVEALLVNGADVRAKNNDGITPLHGAGWNGDAAMVEALLANGADVRAKDNDGYTPLHWAAGNGHAAAVEALLANGADVRAKNNDGNTPRDLAASEGHDEVVRLLENAAAGPNASANSDAAKAGAAARESPPPRQGPGEGGGRGGPYSATDGAGKPPGRNPEPGEPPERVDAPSSSEGGAAGGRGELPRVKLTEDDYAFLAIGREQLARDGTNGIIAISEEERSALRDLTANLDDIERSLESVRELPSSLSGRGPEVSQYFFFFTGAFERAYVASQAVSTGAVKVQLHLSLEALLRGTGWVAENCGLPFAGCISIFSAMIEHQQSTKKTNTFMAFEEFFRGNSRDHYMLTHRKLGEQLSLQLDVSSLNQSDPGKTSKLKEGVKNNIVAPIRKYLRKIHLDAIQQLNPIEEKAMAHLSSLTKEVLRLHQEEHNTYLKLRASNEDGKASYFVRHFGKPLKSAHPKNKPTFGTDTAQSTDHSDGDTGDALRFVKEKMKSVKEFRDANGNGASANAVANMALELKQLQAQVRKLISKDESQNDTTVSCGGQAQVQLNPSKSKEDHASQLGQFKTTLMQIEEEIRQLHKQQEKQHRDVDKVKLENFINNRVLTYHEAFELTRTIISMAHPSGGDKIEVSEDGRFAFRGKSHCIGVVRKGGVISRKKTLWKGIVAIKLEAEHQGVKSVMDWFDGTGLRPFYERNKKAAIRAVFAEELESEPHLADMVQPYRHRDEEGDREKLGL